MNSSTFLRVASIITLLYFAGHTAGIPWTPAVGPGEVAVLEAMKSHSFATQGFQRTYWDFYFGFGVIICGNLAPSQEPTHCEFAQSSLHSWSRLSSMQSWRGNTSLLFPRLWRAPFQYVWRLRSLQRAALKRRSPWEAKL